MHDDEARLSAAIAALTAKYRHQIDQGFLGLWVCDGWPPIVTKLFEHVETHLTVFDPLSTKIERLVREAAKEAARTCERCGAPGQRTNLSGHVAVACAAHAADWGAPC